ncbi:MAG TPA: putative porin [Candidatus Binatia bacterium]|nr:putative porin [Candidatus Binatia bacterium]
MMKQDWLSVWLAAALVSTGVARARTLEEILQEKGVIDASEAAEAKAAREKEQAATEKAVSSIPALPEWVKTITFFGDVRIRNESFFQDGSPDRIRQRFRLRFGAKVKPTDEIETGFKLSSGNPDDPISNNQTFTDEFTPKELNIANAYIKLTPYKSIGLQRPWVTLMGGKFDQPMYVPPTPNQLVFDPDLTPEGFYESLKVVDEKEGFLRTLALNLGQFIFQENSNTGEAAIYGFQGVGTAALGDALWTVGVADYHYVDPSSIAVARNTNSSLTITNFVTLSDGTVVGGKPVSPGTDAEGNPITITKFNSAFNDLDVATDVLIPTGMPAFPLRVFGDFVDNTETSSDDMGYQGGVTIGASRDPGDFFFTYAYEYLETDAVVSAFTNSDYGRSGGTNTKAHILQSGYTLTKNLSFLSTAWIDTPVDKVSGRNSNTDVRWQVDAIAKF